MVCDARTLILTLLRVTSALPAAVFCCVNAKNAPTLISARPLPLRSDRVDVAPRRRCAMPRKEERLPIYYVRSAPRWLFFISLQLRGTFLIDVHHLGDVHLEQVDDVA